jgi:hypothetical protein
MIGKSKNGYDATLNGEGVEFYNSRLGYLLDK